VEFLLIIDLFIYAIQQFPWIITIYLYNPVIPFKNKWVYLYNPIIPFNNKLVYLCKTGIHFTSPFYNEWVYLYNPGIPLNQK